MNIRAKNVNPHTQCQQFPDAGEMTTDGKGVESVQRGVLVGVSDCLTLRIQLRKAGAAEGVNGGPQNVRLRISIKLRKYTARTAVICLLYPN